eukprot:scaffold214_cov249-Pinguiococcus_pyrenoidosus.AAC.20
MGTWQSRIVEKLPPMDKAIPFLDFERPLPNRLFFDPIFTPISRRPLTVSTFVQLRNSRPRVTCRLNRNGLPERDTSLGRPRAPIAQRRSALTLRSASPLYLSTSQPRAHWRKKRASSSVILATSQLQSMPNLKL